MPWFQFKSRCTNVNKELGESTCKTYCVTNKGSIFDEFNYIKHLDKELQPTFNTNILHEGDKSDAITPRREQIPYPP